MNSLALNSTGALRPVSSSRDAARAIGGAAGTAFQHAARNALPQATFARRELGASPLWASRETSARITQAQVANRYLERLDAELGDLRASLTNVMRAPSEDTQLRVRRQLEQVQASWAGRAKATQGSLDDRLSWSPDAQARRLFRIRGLSAEALEARASNDAELLSFSIAGGDRMQGALMTEPGRERAGTLRKLETALAPLGIRIEQADKDGIVFSTEESHWSAVNERLVVRGGGNRFPAGQYVHPQLESLPAALTPQSWNIEDAPAQQRTVYAVDAAREQVTLARTRVSQFLLEAGASFDAAAPEDGARMAAFAQSFAEAGQVPAFEWLSKTVPSMKGITRERVMSLLQG